MPPAIEPLYVGPNQITLEWPFLLRSITGTREAYNLDGQSVEEKEFAISAAPLTRGDLDKNGATLQHARIWDWRALEPQLQQIQGLRPYYRFAGVHIDRYMIDGAERQVMITARELDVDKLPVPAKVWVNLALKYTHGYGVVVVPVNEMDGRGNPVLWAHDIPIKASRPPYPVLMGDPLQDSEMTDQLTFYTHPMPRSRIVRWMLEKSSPMRVRET